MRPNTRALFTVSMLALSLACTSAPQAQSSSELPDYVIAEFGAPPAIPTGDLSSAMKFAMRVAFIDSATLSVWDENQQQALEEIKKSGDPRFGWLIADLLRFVSGPRLQGELTDAASALMGKELPRQDIWGNLTDHLMAWDIPAPPDYLRAKRAIFTSIVPGWEEIFVEGDIDWRLVSWGGVLIDDRAYPRQIMEVREMVNDTLGGRDLGIPYCTLCGAAQAYFTDELPAGIERPVLRTSGLLIRSNKVMYDVNTYSVFDTFLGKAVTGPLAEKGIKLEQASVVTTDWASWWAAHPDTTVLLERYALGRDFDFRNGRDADGPIFPIGDVDPRLPVHEDVIGIVTASGTPVAFQRSTALAALLRGEEIAVENVRLALDAGGIKAVDSAGNDLGSHQAFWFAWSQFHPETELWGS